MYHLKNIRIGVSTWAVHDSLGSPPLFGVEAGNEIPRFDSSSAEVTLLDLPARLADQGFGAIQICHFHLPSRDCEYLDRLRDAIEASGLELNALLVDAGDITHLEFGERDAAWVANWLPVAAQLGAKYVRVIAGKTTGEGALERSVKALSELITLGQSLGVKVMIENWFDLMSSPEAMLYVLERCDSSLGLLVDSDNWTGEGKYEKLAHLAPLANACHFHAHFVSDGQVNQELLSKFLQLPFQGDFDGPLILVNGGLRGLEPIRESILKEIGCLDS